MSKPPPYGIIYNWDGAPHGYDETPQTMASFIDRTYAPLSDTQVGAHFWCVGEHAARWDSDVLELLGDVHGRKYESAAAYTFTENIRLMLERDEDPQKSVIERGHELGMHVYASVRMNDNHFDGAQISDLATLHHTELTDLRKSHPEWLLGDKTSEWFALSWNLAIPEVRQHRLAHVAELCRKYDWDGVELDWQRHAFHLPEDEAYRLRYLLTDLQRAIRQMACSLAAERGRPFHVAVRVAGTLEQCANIGYDLPTWVDEGLMDIVIPAGGAATDPSLDVASFVSLCEGRDIAVYPGFDGSLPDSFVGPEDAGVKDRLRTRAIASRYHKSGADGIYVFNWHANGTTRQELLNQVGSLETLSCTSKIYAATHRFIQKDGPWRGAYRIDRTLGVVPVPLQATLTEDGPTIELDIVDDVKSYTPESLVLRLRLDQWVRGDHVLVLWDGIELANPNIEFCKISDPQGISAVSAAIWQSYALDPSIVSAGNHTVQAVLKHRNPQVACDLVLTDLELVIRY
ncbi:MAG: family 10 glycosylhydrolase [Candidatus Latescibacteria bacterium]|nr:family 10 glycosylhydrolase [Candidatus Latescibacterota bacterium]